MFARVAFVACLALLVLGPAAKGEDASRAAENGSVAAVSKAASMAEHELEIGRYYMSRRNYTGAINRFKVVVTRFPSSSGVDEALFHLVQAYLALGIRNEAQAAAAAVSRKFPDSHWRSDALDILTKAGLEPAEDEKSWIQ
jgi:outer membrane protein assembly factor BamD